MIGHGIIYLPAPPVWGSPPANWIVTDNEGYYLFVEELVYIGSELQPPNVMVQLEDQNPTLVGWWDEANGKLAPVDIVRYKEIRPFGNYAGRATKQLRYHYWLGFPDRELDTDGSLYPSDEQPFDLEFRHIEQAGKWAWRCEMHGEAGTRDPGVRAIGVYSDPECTQYLYTTGAFVQGVSEWQDGAPTVWYCQTPPGFESVDKGEWYLAVLYGAAQEGYLTLSPNEDSERYLFWENNQPVAGSDWVDSGATVTGQSGQLYYISDPAVVDGLEANQAIRFGDTAETTFVSVWAGTDNLIQINPYVAANAGDVLWVWQ